MIYFRPIFQLKFAWTILAAGLAFLGFCFASYWVGMRQIAGYDISPIVNLAYRIHLGQVVHLDFFSPFPPIFTQLVQLGFEGFGQSWSSFVWVGSIFYGVACLSIYFLFSRSIGSWSSGLLALHCFCATGLLMGYLWYGSITMLLIMILVGFLLLSAKSSRVGDLGVVVLLALMLLSKPNMSFPMFLMAVVWLGMPSKFGGAGRWRFAGVAMLSSIVLAFVYSMAIGVNVFAYAETLSLIVGSRSTEFLDTIFKVLEKIRATPVSEWYSISGSIGIWVRVLLHAMAGMMFMGLLFVSGVLRWALGGWPVEQERGNMGLSVVLALVGGISVSTNADFPQASFPLLILSLILLNSGMQGRIQRFGMYVLILLLSIELGYFGLARERVKAAGEGSFWEQGSTLTRETQGFFKGADTGPSLKLFQSEVQRFLDDGGSRNIFFGPRVEFAYALFGVSPPNQMPLWFHPGLSWPLRAEGALTERWASRSFDVVILYKNDAGEMPDRMKDLIRQGYEFRSPGFGFTHASIWVKK